MAFLGLVRKATLDAAVTAERATIDALHEDRVQLQTALDEAMQQIADTQLELSRRTTELAELRGQLQEATRRNLRLASEYSKVEHALGEQQAAALVAQQQAAERYAELERKHLTAVAEACDAQAECERWAHAVRNGAGAGDLDIPARPRRKTTRKPKATPSPTSDCACAPATKKTSRRRKSSQD